MAALEAMMHPKLQRFLRYWLDKAWPNRLPGRRAIDPVEIPDLLSGLYLIDIVPADLGVRFRVRLAGQDHANALAQTLCGRYIDDLFEPPKVDAITASFKLSMKTRYPYYDKFVLPVKRRELYCVEQLVAPLAADGKTVDMLIGMAIYRFDTCSAFPPKRPATRPQAPTCTSSAEHQ